MWVKLLHWKGIFINPGIEDYELQWASNHVKGKFPRDEIYKIIIEATVYFL